MLYWNKVFIFKINSFMVFKEILIIWILGKNFESLSVKVRKVEKSVYVVFYVLYEVFVFLVKYLVFFFFII